MENMSLAQFLAWVTGFLAALGGLVGTVMYVRNSVKRDASGTKLAEAQDSRQMEILASETREYRSLKTRFDVLETRYEAALVDVKRLEAEIVRQQFAVTNDKLVETQKQLMRAAAALPARKAAGSFR